jgi:hypothetical protein
VGVVLGFDQRDGDVGFEIEDVTRIAQVRTRLPVGRERFIVSYHDVVAIDAGFSWRTRKVTRRLDLFGWASTAV